MFNVQMESTNVCESKHKTRKKSRRMLFQRNKNDERRRQAENGFKRLTKIAKLAFTSVTLPEKWQAISGCMDVQYHKLEVGSNGIHGITRTIMVHSNLTWSVFVKEKKVPATSKLLTDIPLLVTSTSVVVDLLATVDSAVLCPGNPDPEFVSLCERRGGVMKGSRGNGDTVANIDPTPVVNCDGQRFTCSVRRVTCELICKRTGPHPPRCQACQQFRSTLRSARSRSHSESEDHTVFIITPPRNYHTIQ